MLSLISSSFIYTEHRNTMQPNATHSNPLQRTTTLPFPTVVHYPGHFHSMIRWESYDLNELLPVFNQKIRIFYLKRSYTLWGESYILSTYYTIFACAGQQSISSFDRKNGMQVESFPEPGDAFLDLPRTLRWYLLLSATHCNISATHCSSVSIQQYSTKHTAIHWTRRRLFESTLHTVLVHTRILTATHYNTLQHVATHCCSVSQRTPHSALVHTWILTATHCSKLQHTIAVWLLQCDAVYIALCAGIYWTCAMMKGTTKLPCCWYCNTLQYIATHWNALQHTGTHCNTLQHAATHCITR